jgi:hypothetical protein
VVLGAPAVAGVVGWVVLPPHAVRRQVARTAETTAERIAGEDTDALPAIGLRRLR